MLPLDQLPTGSTLQTTTLSQHLEKSTLLSIFYISWLGPVGFMHTIPYIWKFQHCWNSLKICLDFKTVWLFVWNTHLPHLSDLLCRSWTNRLALDLWPTFTLWNEIVWEATGGRYIYSCRVTVWLLPCCWVLDFFQYSVSSYTCCSQCECVW